MIKTHNNKMGYIKPCSHQLSCTLTHSHPLPSTPTHFYSFLTHYHSFLAFSHTLPLMFSSLLLILHSLLTMCRLSSHSQSISKYSHPIQPITYHSNPNLVPMFYVPTCFMYLCTYVPLCFTCPCAYAIHFYAFYSLFLHTLHAFVCVNTTRLFIYTVLFLKMLVIAVFLSQCLFPPLVSLPMFFQCFHLFDVVRA